MAVFYALTWGLSTVGCAAEVGWLPPMFHAGSQGPTSSLNLQRRGKPSQALDVERRALIPMKTESGLAVGRLWVGVSPCCGMSVCS